MHEQREGNFADRLPLFINRFDEQPLDDLPKHEDQHAARGNFVPTTLAATRGATIAQKGADSAVAQYRRLRQTMELGKYDFGEWSMNEFARTLREQGKVAEAIAMLELNSEFYPNSPAISMGLGDMYRETGDKAKALERYKKVLERQPNNPVAKQRVEELSKP
jgi:predicted Zn-dependent protease